MTSPRGRRADAVRRTDDAVFGALESVIRSGGWDAVTATGVAREAGTSVGAIYSRAESLAELANQAWVRSVGPSFVDNLGAVVEGSRTADAGAFDDTVDRFDRYAAGAAPAIELGIASFFDEELDEVVGRSLREGFDAIVSAPGHSRHDSACAALILSYFCGRAMARCRLARMPKVDAAGRAVHRAFWRAEPEEFSDEPPAGIEFLRPVPSDRDSPTHRSAIEVLGRHGYRRATVARIARRAGMTPGAVLPSGSTKAELLAAAAEELVMSPREVWESFVERNGGDTSGTARARFVRGIVRPEHDRMRRVNLELARVAESVDEFAAFRAPRDVLQQTHQGLMFVACFASGLHELPYLGPFRAGSAT